MERDWLTITIRANENQLIEQIIELRELANQLETKARFLLSTFQVDENAQIENDK